MRVELPENGWAELRQPRKMTERQRRAYTVAATAVTQSLSTVPQTMDPETGQMVMDTTKVGPEQQTLMDDAYDQLMLALIEAWSYPQPIVAESLLELPIDAFDALRKACLPLAPEVLPQFDLSPDPKATTNGSSGQPPVSPATDASTSATP